LQRNGGDQLGLRQRRRHKELISAGKHIRTDYHQQYLAKNPAKSKILEATIAVWNDFNAKLGSFSDEYSSL
jgi:hypothetical protein